MKHKITICANHYLIASISKLGVIGENNAEILRFVKPADINGERISNFVFELVFSHDNDSYFYEVEGDEFPIKEELTAYPEIEMFVRFLKDNEVKWKSYPLTFFFYQNGNESGVNPGTIREAECVREINAVLSKEYSNWDEALEGIEGIPLEITNELRGSLKTNIGYPADSTDDYDRMSLEQLIGKKQPDPGDGVVLGNDYNDGVFYKIRNELDSLYKLFQGDDEILSNSKERAFRSVEGIRSGLDNIKRKAVESLNAVLKPETPYDFDMPWTEITQLFNSLPSDVANIVTSSVDDNSSELRDDVDNKVSALCRQYEVDVDLITGSWFATLESISILCDALNAKGSSQDSAWAEIIKENIENDTTFNLTLRSLWSLGTASNPLKLPYFKTDKAVFTMDTNSHPSNVEELGFDCSNITYVNGYIFASSPYLKKVILTGLDKRSKSNATSGNFIGFFGSVKSLEEFYTDRICVINYAQTSLQNFFYNCSKLHTIGGFNAETRQIDDALGYIDFTGVTNTGNMFYNCQALQNVRFTEGTLTIGLDLSASPVLSKASVLSALYATAQVPEGSAKPTIKFNAAIDDSDSDIQNAITYATNNGFIVSIGGNSYQ